MMHDQSIPLQALKRPGAPRSAAPFAVRGGPLWLLRLEGVSVLCAAGLAYAATGAHWGDAALWFLLPDISMLFYFVGPRAGAIAYNAAHSYIGPIVLGSYACLDGRSAGVAWALVWVAHIALDRALGYGLKYRHGFHATHLGRVGPRRRAVSPQ